MLSSILEEQDKIKVRLIIIVIIDHMRSWKKIYA